MYSNGYKYDIYCRFQVIGIIRNSTIPLFYIPFWEILSHYELDIGINIHIYIYIHIYVPKLAMTHRLRNYKGLFQPQNCLHSFELT